MCKSHALSWLILGYLLTVSIGCKERGAQNYIAASPSYFPERVAEFEDNKSSDKGVKLGFKLFREPLLSGNGKVSCATCHRPDNFFADPGMKLSTQPGQEPPLRHTPALSNLAWQTSFFWDGGSGNLESTSSGPIKGHREMNKDMKVLVHELQNHKEYPEMFRAAFGTDSIVSAYILRALAQYMRSEVDSNTIYDAYLKREYQLSDLELEGEQVFLRNCAACHQPPLFTDHHFHNTGLDTVFEGGEFNLLAGRARITGKKEDLGKYKTPSLRNWKHTPPYMHDGRLSSITDVLHHYRFGLKESNTLDSLLKDKGNLGLKMDEAEIPALLAFLELLNTQDP